MAEKTKNLCAQIPESLHVKVCQEKELSGKTLSQYITELLNKFYGERRTTPMENTRTMAFQISEELFQRIKDYLAAESERTGRKISQKEFVLDCVCKALDEAQA